MQNDFETQVDKIVANTEARLLAVVQTSIDDLVEDVQTPVAKGGRMRVLTGFLRASGIASLNKPPVGPSKGEKKQNYVWNGESVGIALAKMKIGDSFYFGWTANYARHREAYDAFLETGLQNWQGYVDAAINKLRNR